MLLRIVHLSDLHYPSINMALWGAVKQETIRLKPHLVIVSGDLVDWPRRDHLDWARAQLDELAGATGARICVVPGNHDVFESGLQIVQARNELFGERFPRGDATIVTSWAVLPAPGAAPPAQAPPARRRWSQPLSWFGIGGNPAPPVSAAQPGAPVRSTTVQPKGLPVPVLVALFDSNPNDRSLAFAAGEVSHEDIVEIGKQLNDAHEPHQVRIAVIHHHVLPIAHSHGIVVNNESLMVLRNAGDVLELLARYRFDLVLHGHKHRAQFARVDFSPADAEGYAISVVSAGAAALTTRDADASCGFNLIEVADNGGITVRAFIYGDKRPPVTDTVNGREGIDFRTFEEPFTTVIQRAFRRARQLHATVCDRRVCCFVVTENGDMLADNRLDGLQHNGPQPDSVTRRHWVGIPAHGWLAMTPTLDNDACDAGCTVDPGPSHDGRHQFMVTLPGHLTAGAGASYHLHHEVANAMMMTQWEDDERRRANPPPQGVPKGQEWVGVLVDYPIEMLEIRLRLPSGFERSQPRVRCDRLIASPEYAIDPVGDNAEISEPPKPAPDPGLAGYVRNGLTFLGDEGVWRLTVRRPMVGYLYQLRWSLPADPPAAAIINNTRAWREVLLGMRDGAVPTDRIGKAQEVFDELTQEFVTMLSGEIADARYAAALFIYDQQKLTLRPVLSRKSWANTPVRPDFNIPLGDGLAGAAFQQRRPIAWANTPEQSPMIRPLSYPGDPGEAAERERAILAIPVCYSDPGGERPSPWNLVGVISYSSWGVFSKIQVMGDETSAPGLIAAVSAVTQVKFNKLLKVLKGS